MNNLTAALAKASPAGYGEAGTRISGAVAVDHKQARRQRGYGHFGSFQSP